MGVRLTTIKRLYARSSNRCAFPNCCAPIILDGVAVGEICHIKARRKTGPRYDASLSAAERDEFSNLLLLCRTCHKLVDADPARFTPEVLANMKRSHESIAGCEITPDMARDAELFLRSNRGRARAAASVRGGGVAIAVGGDNHGPITVSHVGSRVPVTGGFPNNSIGADANMAGYIDYLMGLGAEYWKGVDRMTPGRLGKMIKKEFGLKTRTRNHIPVERFSDLVNFIMAKILAPSPVGRRHARNGTRLCRTFQEWRSG